MGGMVRATFRISRTACDGKGGRTCRRRPGAGSAGPVGGLQRKDPTGRRCSDRESVRTFSAPDRWLAALLQQVFGFMPQQRNVSQRSQPACVCVSDG